ncbi:MAG TPA: isoprenylcysteine carboxylmethyltransferase family protein [Phenylobacterium sp.]|uniref:isoprenylcysteine carboxylmethyltransferase family protein n=1 Tax=Phenylobacterium sp. TaxID=1871053 RepID=UPI002B469EDE|nr:isoprenylcysteine carboxylmethyltransferase family protein [Phenylobacterium sp.]HKR86577.1 isoprenylcysteine carboxylmethyltransferase family protein [Phenylobacterium sp.]
MSVRTVLPALVLQSVAGFAVAAVLLFLPAGTLAWPEGWAFLILFTICSLVTDIWLLRRDPALLAARMRSPLAAGQSRRDRTVMAAILVAFVGWIVFMPLDAQRFGWSRTPPPWVQALGAALVVAAFWGWFRVLRANSFAATTIQLQRDRGQRVITTGPYAIVRHPMYASSILLMLGAPLMLGSLWGLAALVVFIPLLAARVLGEEAMLFAGLPGYADYARKVRFRLAPGIW